MLLVSGWCPGTLMGTVATMLVGLITQMCKKIHIMARIQSDADEQYVNFPLRTVNCICKFPSSENLI